MRTIQEYLKECDRESIINSYIYQHTFDYELMDEKFRGYTVGEIIDRQTELLNGLIDRLISITPKPDEEGETWILMSVHSSDSELGDVRHILVKKSDVLDESLEYVTPYGYEFSWHEDVVGFYVADTYLTQYNLEDLIVDYLFEVSFTGYEQEALQETLDDLKEAQEEVEKGTAKLTSWDDMKKELEDDGFEFEKKDPDQEKAWHEYIQSCGNYSQKCQQIEIKKLREMLKD